ncbi:MAG: hypothetical protein RL094_317 [Candidatus Parcubacteria bacterium]|jgi:ribonuclease R
MNEISNKDKKTNIETGIISLNSKGKGFLNVEHSEEDISIEPDDIGLALHGDTVEVETYSGYKGAIQGKVVRVLERKKIQFVGTVMAGVKNVGEFFLEPDDRRAHIAIWIKNLPADASLKEGLKAVAQVSFDAWTEGRIAPGTLVKVIGEKGNNNVEMESIVIERGFDTTFTQDVIDSAEESRRLYAPITDEEVAKRRDFRKVFTCTIDPFDAKDFDDALSLRELDEKDQHGNALLEIGVHIADVSHFVREGTPLDDEARRRATSVYLVDRTVPMLPSILSTDVCSLNPHEDRFAFSAVFKMNRNGEIHDRWFGQTVIYSDKRFTYENAQEVLDAGTGEYFKELNEFNQIAKIFQRRRKNKGSIDFDSTEIKFKLDENGKPIAVYKKERLDTHKLVEEFMLLANQEVAKYVYDKNKQSNTPLAGVYRVHDLPNHEKLHELAVFVKAMGIEFNPSKKITPKEVQKLLQDVIGNSAETAIKTATLRSMAKALYSTKNVGHFGLAFEYYTHFTSPIRRYPDLMVHRILGQLLQGKVVAQQFVATLEKICEQSSRREIEAADAERASIKYKQVEYMQDKIGQEFDAVISGIADWGIYVEEPEAKAEGLIRLRDLPGDFYEVDQKNYKVVGQKTKREFHLGDPIRVKLLGADLENRMLDFVIIDQAQ